jgi:hypothetical protein
LSAGIYQAREVVKTRTKKKNVPLMLAPATQQHQAQVHVPAPRVMDQWGIGVGGPQTLPHAHPDARLFQPAPV